MYCHLQQETLILISLIMHCTCSNGNNNFCEKQHEICVDAKATHCENFSRNLTREKEKILMGILTRNKYFSKPKASDSLKGGKKSLVLPLNHQQKQNARYCHCELESVSSR